MTLQLSEDVSKTITDRVWEQWQKTGITSRFMSYLELKHCADFFLKLCKEQGRDYREFDFYMLVDSNLNYYENRAEIENELGGLNSEKEKEIADKLKDYLTDNQLKEYTSEEKNIIETLQNKNKNLDKKLNHIIKKMDENQCEPTGGIDETLKREMEEMSRIQTLIMARLDQLPNLDQQITALLSSQKFKDLGRALQPLSPNIQEQPNKPKPVVKPKRKIALLDMFAAVVVTIMFIGFTYGILSAFGIGWGSIVGLSALWLTYVVVVRLVAGGILD
jgi:hypothetical protein